MEGREQRKLPDYMSLAYQGGRFTSYALVVNLTLQYEGRGEEEKVKA